MLNKSARPTAASSHPHTSLAALRQCVCLAMVRFGILSLFHHYVCSREQGQGNTSSQPKSCCYSVSPEGSLPIAAQHWSQSVLSSQEIPMGSKGQDVPGETPGPNPTFSSGPIYIAGRYPSQKDQDRSHYSGSVALHRHSTFHLPSMLGWSICVLADTSATALGLPLLLRGTPLPRGQHIHVVTETSTQPSSMRMK